VKDKKFVACCINCMLLPDLWRIKILIERCYFYYIMFICLVQEYIYIYNFIRSKKPQHNTN